MSGLVPREDKGRRSSKRDKNKVDTQKEAERPQRESSLPDFSMAFKALVLILFEVWVFFFFFFFLFLLFLWAAPAAYGGSQARG